MFKYSYDSLRQAGNYQGYLAFERLLASGDPFGALKKVEGKRFFEQYTEQAIRSIKGPGKQFF